MNATAATWLIAVLATAGVMVRPWALPEAIWAVSGSALLVSIGLLPARAALAGVLRGSDVYLFLTGMMLLAELARQEGLFDWLAAKAARLAKGSAGRLFTLIYLVGVAVTAFLSNDATAVVLTPAVAAVAKAARADPLPYLFICAFVANAASFVLPISNPANLVVFGSAMPPLLVWLPRFLLPSILSIAATYLVLRWTQRAHLRASIRAEVEQPILSAVGRLAGAGIAAGSVILLAASAFDLSLGWPTFAVGFITAVLVWLRSKHGPTETLRGISWGVLPLVAGLFVLVEALERTGVTQDIASLLRNVAGASASGAAWFAGLIVAVACNLINNLPAGLLAGRVTEVAAAPEHIRAAILIGIDLGPNLSVTGSLATILWLAALRREGLTVSAWSFLKLGFLVMPPALLLSLAAALAPP